MNLGQRLDILVELGDYLRSEDLAWQAARERAHQENGWFTPEFIRLAVGGIGEFLQRDKLEKWIAPYQLTQKNEKATIHRPGHGRQYPAGRFS